MKIICFGDSNTYGYDPRYFFGGRYPAQHRWVDILAQKLNCQAINAGENGREIPSKAGDYLRFNQMLDKQKPIDSLVIMLGSNDLLQGNSPKDVAHRMKHFLEHIDLEKARILLIAPPPMHLGEWVPTQSLANASVALSREYKTISKHVGVRFAAAHDWNIPITFDGVHFTEEGHKAFAEGLANYLNKGD